MNTKTPHFTLSILLLILQTPPNTALYAYDCASNQNSILKVSLNEVAECDIQNDKLSNSTTYMQLLQLTDYAETHVRSCLVTVHRQLSHCGMHHHASMVKGGTGSYIKEISREECNQMHINGNYKFKEIDIPKLKSNTTVRSIETIAGSVSTDGRCQGSFYKDDYGEWSNVVVIAEIKITLKDYTVRIHLDKEQIITPSGLRCTLAEGKCTDHDGGTLFWDAYPINSCRYDKYTVIHEGFAKKIQTTENNTTNTIISVESKEITFAFTITASDMICGYLLSKTEHPRLFVLEGKKDSFFKSVSPIKTHDLDLFNYINSKFVYTEKVTKREVKSLYFDVITKRCELERKVLQNSLTLAIINPDQFATTYMKSPGYTAVITGEVIQIIKCIKVEVTLAQSERCYQELPVLHDGELKFLAPRTRLLKRRGFELDCNSVLPSTFDVDGIWYKMIPRPVETPPPEVIRPNTEPTWNYHSPKHLANAGIYTPNDLKKLTDFIMQPSEQAAIVNVLTRITTGHDTNTQGVRLVNFIDAESLTKIAHSTWNKMWGWFSTFGITSAGLLGIYFILKSLKLIFDTALHCFQLHSLYGCSLWLLGAVWDSFTYLLVHLRNNHARSPPPILPALPPENLPAIEPQININAQPNIYNAVPDNQPIRPPRRNNVAACD